MSVPANTVPKIEIPTCPVCFEEYNDSTKIPKQLPCGNGHTLCGGCVTQLSTNFWEGEKKCPECRVAFSSTAQLPTNVALVRFIATARAVNNAISNTAVASTTSTTSAANSSTSRATAPSTTSLQGRVTAPTTARSAANVNSDDAGEQALLADQERALRAFARARQGREPASASAQLAGPPPAGATSSADDPNIQAAIAASLRDREMERGPSAAGRTTTAEAIQGLLQATRPTDPNALRAPIRSGFDFSGPLPPLRGTVLPDSHLNSSSVSQISSSSVMAATPTVPAQTPIQTVRYRVALFTGQPEKLIPAARYNEYLDLNELQARYILSKNDIESGAYIIIKSPLQFHNANSFGFEVIFKDRDNSLKKAYTWIDKEGNYGFGQRAENSSNIVQGRHIGSGGYPWRLHESHEDALEGNRDELHLEINHLFWGYSRASFPALETLTAPDLEHMINQPYCVYGMTGNDDDKIKDHHDSFLVRPSTSQGNFVIIYAFNKNVFRYKVYVNSQMSRIEHLLTTGPRAGQVLSIPISQDDLFHKSHGEIIAQNARKFLRTHLNTPPAVTPPNPTAVPASAPTRELHSVHSSVGPSDAAHQIGRSFGYFQIPNREEAIKILREHDQKGSFLTRPSSKQGHFSITYLHHNNSISHYTYKIEIDPTNPNIAKISSFQNMNDAVPAFYRLMLSIPTAGLSHERIIEQYAGGLLAIELSPVPSATVTQMQRQNSFSQAPVSLSNHAGPAAAPQISSPPQAVFSGQTVNTAHQGTNWRPETATQMQRQNSFSQAPVSLSSHAGPAAAPQISSPPQAVFSEPTLNTAQWTNCSPEIATNALFNKPIGNFVLRQNERSLELFISDGHDALHVPFQYDSLSGIVKLGGGRGSFISPGLDPEALKLKIIENLDYIFNQTGGILFREAINKIIDLK